jgi:hypothetical protein
MRICGSSRRVSVAIAASAWTSTCVRVRLRQNVHGRVRFRGSPRLPNQGSMICELCIRIAHHSATRSCRSCIYAPSTASESDRDRHSLGLKGSGNVRQSALQRVPTRQEHPSADTHFVLTCNGHVAFDGVDGAQRHCSRSLWGSGAGCHSSSRAAACR